VSTNNGIVWNRKDEIFFSRHFLNIISTVEGEIPEEIALLGPVKSIWLNNNKLHGSVPVSFGKLKELNILYLESNQLTGQLPKAINENGLLCKLCRSFVLKTWFSYLTQCLSLATIYIQHNNFGGDWPFCFFGYNQIKNYGLDCDKVVCRLGCVSFEFFLRLFHLLYVSLICYLLSERLV